MACNPKLQNLFFVLQANDEYVTIDGDNVIISMVDLEKKIPLAKGKRQTLLIPSNTSKEWLLVSLNQRMIKIKTQRPFNISINQRHFSRLMTWLPSRNKAAMQSGKLNCKNVLTATNTLLLITDYFDNWVVVLVSYQVQILQII